MNVHVMVSFGPVHSTHHRQLTQLQTLGHETRPLPKILVPEYIVAGSQTFSGGLHETEVSCGHGQVAIEITLPACRRPWRFVANGRATTLAPVCRVTAASPKSAAVIVPGAIKARGA